MGRSARYTSNLDALVYSQAFSPGVGRGAFSVLTDAHRFTIDAGIPHVSHRSARRRPDRYDRRQCIPTHELDSYSQPGCTVDLSALDFRHDSRHLAALAGRLAR